MLIIIAHFNTEVMNSIWHAPFKTSSEMMSQASGCGNFNGAAIMYYGPLDHSAKCGVDTSGQNRWPSKTGKQFDPYTGIWQSQYNEECLKTWGIQ
jgi:hypothetical protein